VGSLRTTPCPPKSIGFAELLIVRNPILIFMQKMKVTKDIVMMKITGNFFLLTLSREEWIDCSE
jgi:hypothetical protein